MRKKTDTEEDIELKLTAMIDVVFLLLIFFLCVTKFPDPEALLKSWLPKNKGLHTSTPQLDLQDVRLVLRFKNNRLTCQHPDINSPTGFVSFETVLMDDAYPPYKQEAVPNWDKIRDYLAGCKQNYKETGQGTKGLPVILDFNKKVPFKYVATALDICAELNIINIQIAAPELKSFAKSV